MNHAEYLKLNERINAYRKEVTERAAAWITENTDTTVDNSFTNLDAYNVGLSEQIGIHKGLVLVWLTHNTNESDVRRAYVPATLLDGVEA